MHRAPTASARRGLSVYRLEICRGQLPPQDEGFRWCPAAKNASRRPFHMRTPISWANYLVLTQCLSMRTG